MSLVAALIELNLADIEDRAAKSEAMRRGSSATQPLTAARLRELCELGEMMMRTGKRRAAALARARALGA